MKRLALFTALALAAAGCGAAREGPERIAGTSRDETFPVAGRGVVAWTVDGVNVLERSSVWVKEDDGDAYRVDVGGPGDRSFSGAIDGARLALQISSEAGSEIELYDLRHRRLLPEPVRPDGRLRTQPALSGRNLAYLETLDFGPVLIAVDLATGDSRVVRAARGRTRLAVGEAAGRWLVFMIWNVGAADGAAGTIALYDFRRRTLSYLDAPSATDIYAPSVTPDGTLYYVQAPRTCGAIELVRRRGERVTRLAKVEGKEIGATYAVAGRDGVEIYYDAWPVDERTCARAGDSDVYRLVVP